MNKKVLIFFCFGFCLLLSTASFAQIRKYGQKFERNKTEQSLNNDKRAEQTQATNSVNINSELFPEELSIEGEDYYVSANRGGGRLGTKDQPARDLASIIALLEPGDRIHIAQGTYTSKVGRSSDMINVPVSIIGGYNDDFTARDPWGEHLTILGGINNYTRSETSQRLGISIFSDFPDWVGFIVIDGLIIDNGDRNRYASEDQMQIIRPANPATQENPTPDSPGLFISVGANTKVIVRNCIIMNCAASQGAMDLRIGKFGQALIENNLIINNTGESIYCRTKHFVDVNQPHFIIRNNTILFSWKYDPFASRGGTSITTDQKITLEAHNNLMGFADFGALNNVRSTKGILMMNNICVGNKNYDYKEGNSDMWLTDMEDFAELTDPESSGNKTGIIHLPLDETWAWAYYNRTEKSRDEMDNEAVVYDTQENQTRAILGLPLQGQSVNPDISVWLHRMSLETALKVGEQKYNGAGCKKP